MMTMNVAYDDPSDMIDTIPVFRCRARVACAGQMTDVNIFEPGATSP